jgi:4-amino-4-deoxy-L-arabinose transferase-like glycosyltransferase
VINKWIKQNRGEFIALLLILLLGAFLRLYKISQYMTFLGDEGRDMIIVRRLLVSHNLVFVGPGTSVGNMYLGPFYYYLIAPFLFLWNFSPVGPSVEVALFGVATVFLVWYISKDWFADNRASFGVLTATFLYAISPVVIVYSRSSWNPNIMPFFALTTLYGIWQVWFNKKWKWLVVAALGFAVVIQSHYLGLILIPLITFFWILSFISSYTDVNQRKKALLYSFLALGSVFALMSPLVVFDAKYDWRNFYAMRNFFAGSDGNISLGFLEIVKKIQTLFSGHYPFIGR